MIAASSSPFTVLISHAAQDRAAAEEVAQRLGTAGISAYLDQDLAGGSNWEQRLRDALVESDAFVAVVEPGADLAPNSTFELGAAMALKKPVFVVQTDVQGDVPGFLKRYSSFPLSEINELAESIRKATAPLSASDRQSLVAAYGKLGMPADRVVTDPRTTQRLAELFQEQSGRSVPASHLASELLRLHKTNRLQDSAEPEGPEVTT